MDYYVTPEWHYAGRHHYSVWYESVKVDEFTSDKWLTHSQMIDVARSYADVLEWYRPPTERNLNGRMDITPAATARA